MTQIGIDALGIMGIALITYIADMFSPKNCIAICNIAIRTIEFCRRRVIHNCLYSPRRLVMSRLKAYNLPRFAADHSDDIGVFPRFCASLFADETI